MARASDAVQLQFLVLMASGSSRVCFGSPFPIQLVEIWDKRMERTVHAVNAMRMGTLQVTAPKGKTVHR